MSFFDEADEPRPTARQRRPPPPRGPRSSEDRQAVQLRRAIAIAALVVLVLVIALGIKGCQDSAHKNALRTYNQDVAGLIQQSNGTGGNLFTLLSRGGGSGNATRLQSQVDQVRLDAEKELGQAAGFSVPDEMRPAQTDLLLCLRMRADGITDLARNIQPALGTSTNRDALAAIASDMARFYASDVLYKSYAVTRIVAELHAAGITVGGQNGETVEGGQFLPDLGWLTPSFIAAKLGAHLATSPNGSTKVAPGLHGHSLTSVSVAGTALQTGSTNTVPASPPPTFDVKFSNGGTNNETNVTVKVTVGGTSVSGQTIVPSTTTGATASAQVTLPSSPTPGTYTVSVTVEPVPGEKNTANNTQSFPVTFR